MKRLLVLTAAVAAAGSVLMSARALERATWVLTNGERISGNVNTHTDERVNIARNQFAVGTSDGRETQVRVDQVAVIEFVGGTPSNQELEKLPANGHMIAMRDGATYPGRLLDLINGESVRWLHSGGRSEDIPISQVARVYMNFDAARRIYNYTRPSSGAGGGSVPGIPDGDGVAVRGDQQWTDTGMAVRQGERYKFSPSGQVRWGGNADMLCGPDGSSAMRSPQFPMPNLNVGALIGRVANTRPFSIGSGPQPILMPASGRLFLGINDSQASDNAGGYRVRIQRTGR